MVIEEPSVVAGASFMAKLARAGGGFTATTTDPLMIGQMQVINVTNLEEAKLKLYEHKAELLAEADAIDPVLKKFGGGARDLEVRIIEDSPIGGFSSFISSMMCVTRWARTRSTPPANDLLRKWKPSPAEKSICASFPIWRIDGLPARVVQFLSKNWRLQGDCSSQGEEVRDGIIAAYAFAAVDPYRAATHNKGIMNGVDAVVIATGNDWRAIEAGAHAYAARSGRYTSLIHLEQRCGRQSGRHARNADGGGNRRRRDQGPPGGAGRGQADGRENCQRTGRDHRLGGTWRKTWLPCAPSPPKASSVDTCPYTQGRSRSLLARPVI